MALNVLIYHKPSITLTKVGSLLCTNQGSRSISGGVEVWQGYFQSIRPTLKKMVVNIDLGVTTFYESGSLLQVVLKVLDKGTIEDLRIISNRDRIKLEKFLKNVKIYTIINDENVLKRRFRISKLTKTPASNTKFDANGQQIDIVTYFNDTYGRRLQYPFLPCIVARGKTYLPMEVCYIVEVRKN
jgi:hypothetical protein